MFRRQFIKLATLTGATGIASLGTLSALETKETKTVNWHVRGFTCVTCAVGLEAMLRQRKGVRSAEASYQGASVTIQYHPGMVSEAALRSFIEDIGFTVPDRRG